MDLLTDLYDHLPGLREAIRSSGWITDPNQTWELLRGFIDAHSPTGNVTLPGSIGDTLASAVRVAGLSGHYDPNFKFTGNAAILLGKKKDQVDLVVDAHLDKPTFGVTENPRMGDGQRAALFACCANRFPLGDYRAPGKALRYNEMCQALTLAARGAIVSRRGLELREELSFEVAEGEIESTDLVTFDVPARQRGLEIIGSGIDDAGGVTVLLATASILKAIEPVLEVNSLNCLFTFSDHEEWPPDSFFSQGASKTTFALPPPVFGSVVVDVHTAGDGYSIGLGQGISYGFISAAGRGALVPLNYQRLTTALAAALNAASPNTAQHNAGYFSRSDDWTLMRWSKMVGLLGIPALNIHLGNETANLGDVVGGIVFLSHYLPLVMGLSPTMAARYHLGTSAPASAADIRKEDVSKC